MKIEHSEHPIEAVFRYFVEGFPLEKEGKELKNWEANYDPRTGKVIFKLYLENKP